MPLVGLEQSVFTACAAKERLGACYYPQQVAHAETRRLWHLQPEVEIEYVSAPREYEELLAPGDGDAAGAMAVDGGGAGEDGPAESRGGLGAGAGLGSGGGGGLGFVAAGAAGGGLGLGFTPAGATPGLGSGGATPGLGLGSDWGSETPGGAGLGLGATPMDATPAPSAVRCAPCRCAVRCVRPPCLEMHLAFQALAPLPSRRRS